MREFSKVSPAVWQSERFNGLKSDDAKFVYLYLLTSPHQVSAGCFHLPRGYASTDLRWQPDRYAVALAELAASDMVAVDDSAQVVGIRRWFRHNPPMSKDHLRGIVRYLSKLPSEEIANAFAAAALEAWEGVVAAREAEEAQKRKAALGVPNGPGGGSASRLETPYLAKGR